MSLRTSIVLVALALIAAVALVAFAHPTPATTPVGGWEYHIVRGGIDIAASPQAQQEQMAAAQGTLNQLGGEGWELVAIQGQFAVLKRVR
jgi:hypothetical protein